jgi:hypothetical protein
LLYLSKAIYIECINLGIQELFLRELFQAWLLWPETKKLVIPFLRIYLFLAFLSMHCVSPHRRFHKLRRISTLKTKSIIFCVYLLDHDLSYQYGSSIQGRSQDGANVEDFKYLSKGKIFLVPILSLSPLCPRMSKHLSTGEEVGTMQFRVGQIKNEWWKKKKRENEYKEKKKRIKKKCMKRKNIYEFIRIK